MGKKYAKKHLAIWNNVWKNDRYAVPQLRKQKAQKKVELFLKLFPDKLSKNSMVLDAGCGGGYVSEYLAERTRTKIVGFDQSEEAMKICMRLKDNENIKIVCSDAKNVPFGDEIADVVLCIGLLEHVKDYNACIEELKRMLKKEGYFFIVSSNKYSSMYVQWLWKHLIGGWKYGYQKNWTPKQLEEIMREHSIEKVSMHVIEGWSDHDVLSRVDCLLRKKFIGIGRYIVYLGQKK